MKKYLTDNFGYTLRNIRENLKLTQTEVFQGILARSTWCNYESELMTPDILTFITLLERMGVSSDRFEFIVPEEVYKFYSWYEECQNYIEAKEWEKLIRKREKFKILKQINVKIQYQHRDFIDYVIERFAYKNLDKALNHIKQALLHTITDIDNIVTNRILLSIFEGHLLTNYYDLIYTMNADDDTTRKLYSFYEYYSHRLNDDLIKGKIIPRIALILLNYDKNILSKENRLKIEHEVFEILIKNYAISTYARAETGKTTPNKKTLNLLKERLKLRAVHYCSEVEVEDYSLLILNSECRRLAATAKFEEAKLKYDELFEKLDMDIIVNKQIIGFFKLYKYSNSSYDLEKLWELLSYNDVEFEQRILFSREELEILSLIAWEEEKNCKRNGIKLLELILEKEGKQRGTYYSRTAIIKRNMVRMLKNDKEYDRSNKLLTESIKNMFIENESCFCQGIRYIHKVV